jgi:hypothetical protein
MTQGHRLNLNALNCLVAIACVIATTLACAAVAVAAPGASGGAATGAPAVAAPTGSGGASTGAAVTTQPDTAASRSPHGQASGEVVGMSWASFTVRTAGKPMSVLNALIAAGDAITADNYPYVWAGGHPAAGAASVGTKGPGYNGRTIGLDCSGTVAAVLAGAGLWEPGTPVPGDAGVIAQLRSEKQIALGRGSGPADVTLYDDPGVHIFMSIDGHFFGTSDGGGAGGDAKGGAGWLNDGAPDASDRAYKQYHVLPSALEGQTTYGPELTFGVGRSPGVMSGLAVGDQVSVSFTESKSGTMTAETLQSGGNGA